MTKRARYGSRGIVRVPGRAGLDPPNMAGAQPENEGGLNNEDR